MLYSGEPGTTAIEYGEWMKRPIRVESAHRRLPWNDDAWLLRLA
jgi:hypothetical protein